MKSFFPANAAVKDFKPLCPLSPPIIENLTLPISVSKSSHKMINSFLINKNLLFVSKFKEVVNNEVLISYNLIQI